MHMGGNGSFPFNVGWNVESIRTKFSSNAMANLQCIISDLGLGNVFKVVCGGRVGNVLSNPL